MRWRRSGRHAAMTLAVLASVAVLAAGCGQSRPPAARASAAAGGPGGTASPSSMSPAQVTAAEDAFSLALFDRVCPSKPGPNLLLSPNCRPGAGHAVRGGQGTDRGVPRAAAPAARVEPGAGRGAAPAHRHAGRAAPARGQQPSLRAVREPARPAGARRPAHRLPHRSGDRRLRRRARDHEPDQRGRRPRDPRPDPGPLPGPAAPVHPDRADQRPLPEGALAEPVPGDQPGAVPYRRRPGGPGAADAQRRPGRQLPPVRRLAVGHAALRRRRAGRGGPAPAGATRPGAPPPRWPSGRR